MSESANTLNESLDALSQWREKQAKLLTQKIKSELTSAQFKEQSKILNAEYKKCMKAAKEAGR